MRLFPEREKMKTFMKKGLPIIFAVAWTPMVWMLMVALLGPVIQHLFADWRLIVSILVVATLLVMIGLVILFRRYALKIFGEAQKQ
jgi:hypothetical protein